MRINCRLLAIVIVAAIVFCHVIADSENVIGDNKKREINDTGKDMIDPAKKENPSKLSTNDSNVPPKPKEVERKPKKANDGDRKNGQEGKGSVTESKKDSEQEKMPLSGEDCDPQDSCTVEDKSLVACLRVPGNDSPFLSLLIQNKVKDPQKITISAPKSVSLATLKTNTVDIQGFNSKQVIISISDLDSGFFINLTAGHGICSLNFTQQYHALKKVDHVPDSSHISIFKITLSTGFLVFAVLVSAVAAVFLYPKLRRSFSLIKGPKYQKLDGELPISQGSKLEPRENEGWDDNWGDNWDDEEAPLTPSKPITPNLSSKGMASRKFNKDSWND